MFITTSLYVSSISEAAPMAAAPQQGANLPPDYGPPPYEASQPGYMHPLGPGEGPMPMPMPMPPPGTPCLLCLPLCVF